MGINIDDVPMQRSRSFNVSSTTLRLHADK